MVFLSCFLSLEHSVFFADLTYHCVCSKDNDESDNRLIEACRSGHSDVSGFHQATVYISINNVCGRVKKTGITRYLEEQTEIGIEDTADAHQSQGNYGGFQERKRDVFDLLPFCCTVKRSCLVKRRVNAVNGGNVDQTSVSDAFPQVDKHKNERPVFRLCISVDCFFSENTQDRVVYDTGALA